MSSPSESSTVLDAGCGIGGLPLFFAERVKSRIVGLSNCHLHLYLARRLSRLRSLRSSVCFFCVGDLNRIPLRSCSCDIVINHETLCHVVDKQSYAESVARVLRPGGKWLILDGFRASTVSVRAVEEEMRRVVNGWKVAALAASKSVVDIAKNAKLNLLERRDYTCSVAPAVPALIRTAEHSRARGAADLTSAEKLHHEACHAWGTALSAGRITYELLHLEKAP